jgi:hypothetical protein
MRGRKVPDGSVVPWTNSSVPSKTSTARAGTSFGSATNRPHPADRDPSVRADQQQRQEAMTTPDPAFEPSRHENEDYQPNWP